MAALGMLIGTREGPVVAGKRLLGLPIADIKLENPRAVGKGRLLPRTARQQGRSGLGLAAQRHDIAAFALREGFAVGSWQQDVQTGAGADALLLRPGLEHYNQGPIVFRRQYGPHP
jgi:hypothetical protein